MQDAEENHDFFIGSRNKKIFIAKIYGFLRVWTLTTGVKLENEKRKLPHNKSKQLSYIYIHIYQWRSQDSGSGGGTL